MPPEQLRSVLTARAREDFAAFCHWIAATTGMQCAPDAAHHQLFCQYAQALAEGRVGRLIITCPPGAAKSTYYAILNLAWRIGRNPALRLGLGCHTDALAEDFSRQVQTIVRSAAYREVFPKVALATDAVGYWTTTAGGSLFGFGAGKAIAGRRLQHLHVDDPVRGIEEAMNPERMLALQAWWRRDVVTRLTPDATISLAMTRWAVQDLAGYLINEGATGGEPWTVIELPMLCTDPARDPLGRAMGERLWPSYYTEAMVAEAQRDVEGWASLYQCTPIDAAGSFFRREWLPVTSDLPARDNCRCIIACDTALTLGGGDYSVILVAYLHLTSGNLYVVDLWRDQVEPEDFINALVETAQVHRPDTVLFDDDNNYKMMVNSISRAFRVAQVSPPYVKTLPLHNTGGMRGQGKQIRATAIRALCSRGEVFIARRGWSGELVQEMVNFPGGRHDDMVDCISLVGREVAGFAAARPPEKELTEYRFPDGRVIQLPKRRDRGDGLL